MGASFSKQAAGVLSHPENEKNARKVFEHLDEDKSGGLSKEEFRAFARIVLEKDLKDIKKDGVYNAPFVGKMMFKEDFGEVVRSLKVGEIDEYLNTMFEVADKDKDGNMTFEEFFAFLKTHYKDPSSTTGLSTEGSMNEVFKEGMAEMKAANSQNAL